MKMGSKIRAYIEMALPTAMQVMDHMMDRL